MPWAPSFEGPRSPWVSLLLRDEDLFFFFCLSIFSPGADAGFTKRGGGGGGGRRCKHWPPGAGDPRYATGVTIGYSALSLSVARVVL